MGGSLPGQGNAGAGAPPAGGGWPDAAGAPGHGNAPPVPGAGAAGAPAWSDVDTSGSGPSVWDGTDTSSIGEDDVSVAPPETVFAAPLVVEEEANRSGPSSEARTAILPSGSALPPTAVHRPPGARPANDLASADTAKSARPDPTPVSY
ncbi:hypothetical protein E1283_36355, partial [Streptomyces hainanensis]